MTTKKQWGGPRPGSGRKKTLVGAVTKSVVFDSRSVAAVQEYANAAGIGFSAACRELITKAALVEQGKS